MRLPLFLIALAALAACAGAVATPYQPSASAGGYGYAETPIEANRVRLAFRGNSLTDRDTVETYLLFRAAETTVEHGFDYFVVASRGTDERTTTYRTHDPFYPHFSPVYWYYSPRFGWRPAYDPFFADPFWRDPVRYREVTRYEAVAEITMHRGAKPAEDASAYDAREVVSNLQGRVVRPTASAS